MFAVKLFILEFEARNFEPSTEQKPHSTAPFRRLLNSRNALLMSSGLSLRKSAIVLKSGVRPHASHIASTLVAQAHASFLDDRIPFL